MSALLHIEEVKHTYGTSKVRVNALQGVSLSANEGEFTAIIGPSGSGKTTLLNIIGGLEKPTSGKVQVAGKDLTRMSSGQLTDFRLHHIGFVFQAYNLVPVLTALENVEFLQLLQGVSARERTQRALALLDRLGLAEVRDRRPAELSGGQQQRVAVARALAARPRFILADEPTANLDTQNAESLLDLLSELNRTDGTTFLLSTHDARVMRRATRIVTLEDGRITLDQAQQVQP
jgi:putative ABC transport system ATP-binding protein